jgi:hypothetical protein
MNQIISFGEKMTADEFVRESLTACRGNRSSCNKRELEEICEKAGVKPVWNDTKISLYDKIIENHIYTGRELAKMFHVGVSGRIYVNHFKISPQTVQKLEKANIIHSVGEGDSFACGKRYKERLYDAYEFEEMDPVTIKEFYMSHRI